jgi:hypothetical protein
MAGGCGVPPGIGSPGRGLPGVGLPGDPGRGVPGTLGFGLPGSGRFGSPGAPGSGWPGAGFPGGGFPGAGFPGIGAPGAGLPGGGFPGMGAWLQAAGARRKKSRRGKIDFILLHRFGIGIGCKIWGVESRRSKTGLGFAQPSAVVTARGGRAAAREAENESETNEAKLTGGTEKGKGGGLIGKGKRAGDVFEG